MAKYYDWRTTFTYDADITMVIGMRDVGKTFGLREQFLRDYRDNHQRFVAISRNKTRIPKLANGYFTAIVEKTQDPKLKSWLDKNRVVFRVALSRIQIGFENEKGKVPKWDDIGYFVSLSRKQDAKEETFVNVRRIVLDEAIIEPDERRYSQYQSDEWGKLASIVDSCSRERPDDDRHKPNIYLLSNACDLVNPWFQELGIDEVPDYGRHWYRGKTFLLDYVDPTGYGDDYANEKLNGTVSGRMLRGRRGALSSASNAFEVSVEFVCERPRSAQYECGFIYRGSIFAVWIDYRTGLTHISSRFAKGLNRTMYALTTEDNKVNYIAAKKAEKALRSLVDAYGVGILRFESVSVQAKFFQLLKDFGVR